MNGKTDHPSIGIETVDIDRKVDSSIGTDTTNINADKKTNN